MKKSRLICGITLVLLMLAVNVTAQQEADSGAQMADMPPMGPPEEILEVAHMAGTWHYEGEMRWEPDMEWVEHEATAVISMVAGGAVMQMEYSGEMVGMPMHGLSLSCYDREFDRWQEIWTDNLSARISFYTGHFEDGKKVLTGTDTMGGVTFFTRITTYDFTDSSYQFLMENSEDGDVWYESMRGTYTKM